MIVSLYWIILGLVLLIFVVALAMQARILSAYIRARSAGVPIAMPDLLSMVIHKIDYNAVVNALIRAKRAGLQVPVVDMARHAMAGGNVTETVSSLETAAKSGTVLSWSAACERDLASRGSRMMNE